MGRERAAAVALAAIPSLAAPLSSCSTSKASKAGWVDPRASRAAEIEEGELGGRKGEERVDLAGEALTLTGVLSIVAPPGGGLGFRVEGVKGV